MTDRTDLGLTALPASTTCGGREPCRDGWLGTEDNPAPCPTHRPHLIHRAEGWRIDRAQLTKGTKGRGS